MRRRTVIVIGSLALAGECAIAQALGDGKKADSLPAGQRKGRPSFSLDALNRVLASTSGSSANAASMGRNRLLSSDWREWVRQSFALNERELNALNALDPRTVGRIQTELAKGAQLNKPIRASAGNPEAASYGVGDSSLAKKRECPKIGISAGYNPRTGIVTITITIGG